MMVEKLLEMRNFDRGDYLEQARIFYGCFALWSRTCQSTFAQALITNVSLFETYFADVEVITVFLLIQTPLFQFWQGSLHFLTRGLSERLVELLPTVQPDLVAL